MAARLSRCLHLEHPPIAISFSESAPAHVKPFEVPMSEPAPDGRRGRVPAGCVFWVHAEKSTFATAPEDHGNCSVGSLTHGLAGFEEVADHEDVSSLLEAGWVSTSVVDQLPKVERRPWSITYGPLAECKAQPDVVLLRVNGRQLMVLSDAISNLRIEGKPQCHIVALAKEHSIPAASVGCALSRARTGMAPSEMTCAIPAQLLPETLERIVAVAQLETKVAKYAAKDALRFR